MIDPDLQTELRAKFNPDGSDLRKMQLRMLDMLKYIDRICNENNIRYWLSSGTCIGAVRHGGFIPWDDDVDIEIMKEDYPRLINILKKNKSQFIVQNSDTDEEYVLNHTKLRDTHSFVEENSSYDKNNNYNGLFIDIFCMEPSNSRFLFTVCRALWSRTIIRCVNIQNKKFRLLILKSLRFFYTKILFLILRPFYHLRNHGKFRHQLGGLFPKPRYIDDISETVRIPFENTTLPVPKGYHHYLSSIYGNYMNIPPLDKITRHTKFAKIW